MTEQLTQDNETKPRTRNTAPLLKEGHAYVIEKNVPIAPKGLGARTLAGVPIEQMENGDSIFFPSENPSEDSKRVYHAVRNYAKAHEREFTVRTVDGGFRLWRTK